MWETSVRLAGTWWLLEVGVLVLVEEIVWQNLICLGHKVDRTFLVVKIIPDFQNSFFP